LSIIGEAMKPFAMLCVHTCERL